MTFGLAVAGQDVESALVIIESRWRSLLEGEQAASADIVLDFSAEQMTCPACLESFSTGPEECPSCGLYLGV